MSLVMRCEVPQIIMDVVLYQIKYIIIICRVQLCHCFVIIYFVHYLEILFSGRNVAL